MSIRIAKKILKFFRRPLGIAIAIAVLGGGGFAYFKNSERPSIQTVAVKRGTITQEVTVTGRTKAAQSVDLTFEKSGKVNRVPIAVGDAVEQGQVLVELERSELAANLLQAQGNLETQQAKLDELRRGTRPEEILVQEAKVNETKLSLEDAQKTVRDAIRDAYTKSDDAVRNKIDQFFDKPQSSSPQITFVVLNSTVEYALESGRPVIETILASWQFSLDTISYDTAKQNLNAIQAFLDNAALALNSVNPTLTFTQTTIDKYRSDVATARTNVNTAVTNLTSAEEKRRGAESSLAIAQKQLELDRAGTAAEEVAAQEAQVKQALAGVRGVQAQIDKTILRSPLKGIITKQDAKVGEIVSSNIPIVSIISAGKYEIEANIPEVDIAKIKVGNPATLTLDAYGPDEIFNARVSKIEPGETIVESVTTYKTTLQFEEGDEKVKPSMTANVDILTDKKEGVLIIPQRAVYAKNGAKFVRAVKNGITQERKVETGIRGSDGTIEITEGLMENEEIIPFANE